MYIFPECISYSVLLPKQFGIYICIRVDIIVPKIDIHSSYWNSRHLNSGCNF